jgi:hypothetical protein
MDRPRLGAGEHDARTGYRRCRLHRLFADAETARRGDTVIGIDCVNDYYDLRLKEARLARLKELGGIVSRS